MKFSMRTILTCFHEGEAQIGLVTLTSRLGTLFPHQPRRDRVVSFLSELPSAMKEGDRFYQRWDVMEAADVEQANEDRAEEAKVQAKLAKTQVTARPPKIERVTLQLRLPSLLHMRMQQAALAQGVSVFDLTIQLFEKEFPA